MAKQSMADWAPAACPNYRRWLSRGAGASMLEQGIKELERFGLRVVDYWAAPRETTFYFVDGSVATVTAVGKDGDA